MDKEYIIRIIKGECSLDEKEKFFEQLSSDKELMRDYILLKNKHVISTLPYKPGYETLLRIRNTKNRAFDILVKIAAVLFIPLFTWFLFNLSDTGKKNDNSFEKTTSYLSGTGIRYKVDSGIKATLTLPDSSKVWLNSDSYLDIPEDFGKSNRIVYLSGEGYFDIESDETSPFLIKTPGSFMVKVTGTEFNLSCYEDDKNMKITLLKGSLQVIKETDNEIINVNALEEVVINYKTLEDKTENQIDTNYAKAWKDGNLRFKNTPMDEVIRKMERWYGIKISVDNPDVYKHTFTADFESESINQVLNLLSISTNITYDITGNNVRLGISAK